MGKKPFVDPNPGLPRRALYGKTVKLGKKTRLIPVPPQVVIGMLASIGRTVDKTALSSDAVAHGPKMIEGRALPALPPPVESTADGIHEADVESIGDGIHESEPLVRSPIIVRLRQSAIDQLDAVRGDKSRADLVRFIVEKALAKGTSGPEGKANGETTSGGAAKRSRPRAKGA